MLRRPSKIPANMSFVDPEITLELDTERSYEPGDAIEGFVSILFSESTRIKRVGVELMGTSCGDTVAAARNNKRTGKTERHQLVHDAHMIFPPPEMMASNEYTVPAGELIRGSFSFVLPQFCLCGDGSNDNEKLREVSTSFESLKDGHASHSPLPPSFKRAGPNPRDAHAEISYVIKVKVSKAAILSLNTEKSFLINVCQRLPEKKHISEKLEVLVSDQVVIKKRRYDETPQAWPISMIYPVRRFPITLRVIVRLPQYLSYGEKVSPSVFIVSDCSPSTFSDFHDDEKEEPQANGLGLIVLQSYTFKIYGKTEVRVQQRVEKIVDIDNTSRFVRSSSSTTINLALLEPSKSFPWLQQECTESYAMDISDFFEMCEIPQLEAPFSTCNIKYSPMISLKMKLAASVKTVYPEEVLALQECVISSD